MSDCLGGYDFFNEEHTRMVEGSSPRLVKHSTVTESTLSNPKAKILEINSKTGLYPLYVVYSIYRARLGEKVEEELSILIREPQLSNIVQKVLSHCNEGTQFVSSMISNDTPFGIPSNITSNKRYSLDLYDSCSPKHDVILYYLRDNTRTTSYVKRDAIKKNACDIPKCKVLIPEAGGSGNDPNVLGKPILAPANSVCSQTFLYASFDNEKSAENFITYLKTKFFRALVSACKISQHTPSKNYRFVPVQDLSVCSLHK